jgi:hypothetical protein
LKFERSIVSISLRKRVRQALLLGCVSGAALLVPVLGQASAATYPTSGGSTFTGGAESWTVTTKCSIAAPLCESSGSYSGTIGNPAGSLADNTKILIGLLGIFSAEATLTSPTFTAAESGAGVLHLERQFEDTELVSLTPGVEYSAYLVDQTNGSKQKAVTEAVAGASGFAAKEGPVALVAGHSYSIEIVATTKSSVASVGLLGGTATFHLDNVSVTSSGSGGGGGGGEGGNGGNGGNGANGGEGGAGGVSSARLESLIQSSLVGSATLKGNKLSVKAKCPAKVGANCTITLQGLLNKHKPATTTRKAKVKKAKTKKFALTVKPAARNAVKTKKKLLFKETVKAGKSKATVYKAIKLVRK